MEVETVAVDTSDVDLPDNDELFTEYVQQLLYPEYGGASLFGNYGEQVLSESQQAVYEKLKSEIERVAKNGGSTQFYTGQDQYITLTWDTSETEADKLTSELSIHVGKILDCLMIDCPYELYWYDKTSGAGFHYNYMKNIEGNGKTASAKIGNFRFAVRRLIRIPVINMA